MLFRPFCTLTAPVCKHDIGILIKTRNFSIFLPRNSISLNNQIKCFVNFQHQYENLVSGTVPIESHLHKKLAEFLNAEIVLGTIIDSNETLLQWIRSTFLHTCTVKRDHGIRTVDEIDAKLKGK